MDLALTRGSRRNGGRRWNVVWPATLVIEGQIYACTILDLSLTGARVEAYGLRRVPSLTSLECDKFGTLPVRVTWVRGNKAGLRFAHPPAEMVEILQKVVPGMGRREAPQPAQPQRASFGRRRWERAA